MPLRRSEETQPGGKTRDDETVSCSDSGEWREAWRQELDIRGWRRHLATTVLKVVAHSSQLVDGRRCVLAFQIIVIWTQIAARTV